MPWQARSSPSQFTTLVGSSSFGGASGGFKFAAHEIRSYDKGRNKLGGNETVNFKGRTIEAGYYEAGNAEARSFEVADYHLRINEIGGSCKRNINKRSN